MKTLKTVSHYMMLSGIICSVFSLVLMTTQYANITLLISPVLYLTYFGLVEFVEGQ